MVFIANFETDFSGKFLTDNLTIFAGENLPSALFPTFKELSLRVKPYSNRLKNLKKLLLKD